MKNVSPIARFVDFLLKSPILTILISILSILAIGWGAFRLHPNFSYHIWFTADNPKLAVFKAFEQKFGSDEVAVLAIQSRDGIFNLKTMKMLTELTEELWKTPEVIRVDSLTNYNWVHGEDDEIVVEPLIPSGAELNVESLVLRKAVALKQKSVKGYLINDKADVSVIYVKLKPSFDISPDYDLVVENILKTLEKYQDGDQYKFYLTGNPVLTYSFKESSIRDIENLVPIVLLIILGFLALKFRALTGVLLPLIVISLTVLSTLGFAGWVAIELNNITTVVPQFMIAISIAVAVHLLVNIFSGLQSGLPKKDAIRRSAIKNFRPTLLTALSTALGFYSFSTSPIPPVANMGIMAGTGTLFSWIISYTIMLPLLRILPLSLKNVKNKASSNAGVTPRSEKLASLIFKYRNAIFCISGLLIASAIYYASKVEVNSDPFEYFDKKYPISIATKFMENNLGGAIGTEIVIDSGSAEGAKEPGFLNKVDEYQTWLDELPFVTKTVSIIDILKDVNKTLHGGAEEHYLLPDSRNLVGQQLLLYSMNLPQGMDINDRISVDNRSIRLTAMWTIHGSKEALQTIKMYEAKAKEMGLNAIVTGKTPLYQSNNEKVVSSFIGSIVLALVLVAILLIFGLGSLKIGLLSMIPNAIPLVIGGGIVGIMKQPLDIGTVLVGSVCLGIAVDDTIHFLANYRRNFEEKGDVIQAVAKVFATTAPALITTTIVLVAAFGAFAFGTFVPNRNFGIFVAMILTSALIFDLIFLPALVMAIDNRAPKKNKL